MKPAHFEYFRASTVVEAVDKLGGDPEARLLAGGQSLIPAMNFRVARPSQLIDINGLEELKPLVARLPENILEVGALVRHQQIATSPLVQRYLPFMATVALSIGHWAIRSRGSVGGSLCHADPAAEWPAFMVAASAQMVVAGRQKYRRIPADTFCSGFMETALGPGEMLVKIEIPLAEGGWGFWEVARRRGDFALAGAVCRRHHSRTTVTWFGADLSGPGAVTVESDGGAGHGTRFWEDAASRVLAVDDDYMVKILGYCADQACRQAQSDEGRDYDNR